MAIRNLFAFITIISISTSARALGAETFRVDPVHSTVVYRVKHFNVSYSLGRFNSVTGSFTLDPADPSQCRFELSVRTDSLDSGNQARDGHLKGPDFFNARQYPTITFKSKSVVSAGQNTYEVKGDLTMHGVTKEVTLKVEQTGMGPGMRGGKLAGLYTEFTLKRSEFGMKNMLEAVGDDVAVTVSIEGGHN
jgi:polyisoprenoid-binding protein YceI